MLPIVADAEAGFGGVLNAHELMKAMIEAGAAGVHFEDQLASAKKCGHMGGKVLVPAQEHIDRLVAARLQADILGTETLIVARTDAEAANLTEADPPNYLCSNHLLVDTEEEAQAALERFEAGEAIADLSIGLSTCPTRPSGAAEGCAVEGQFGPEF